MTLPLLNMMNRLIKKSAFGVLRRFATTIALSSLLLLGVVSCDGGAQRAQIVEMARPATIYPDYSGVTLPRNISSISFKVTEEADSGKIKSYNLEVSSNGRSIYTKKSSDGEFLIPDKRWREVVANSQFEMVITTFDGESRRRYDPIVNYVAESDIDQYLSYRLIAPGYELWRKMGIYQRDLTEFKQYTILDNDQARSGCLNCHSYGAHTTANSMVHYRGVDGGTIISHNDKLRKVNFNGAGKLIGEATYPVWHPSAQFIAFSVNEVAQFFHLTGDKPIEVNDSQSDIILYDISRNEVIADTLLHWTSELETFPDWSSDGRTLFFASAESGNSDVAIDSIRYNLYSVDFDPSTRRFSDKKLLFDAESKGLSISNAKATKCGRYVVATVADYGTFMIWHEEAEIVIIDIESGEWRYVDEINGPFADSYHSFDSSGEWMVFSSRRGDGLFTRPYITRFDSSTGRFTKSFILPQSSVEFYDDLFFSYNIPNFSKDLFTQQREFMEMSRESTITHTRIIEQ